MTAVFFQPTRSMAKIAVIVAYVLMLTCFIVESIAQRGPTCRLLPASGSLCWNDGRLAPCQGSRKAASVTRTGAWRLSQNYMYYLDLGFTRGLLDLVGNGSSVIEYGAGTGCYTWELQRLGLNVRAFDGVPNVKEITGGLVRHLDLSNVAVKDSLTPSDWVLCMEVMEHIPSWHEETALSILRASSKKGIVMSWAPPTSVGVGHVNTRPHNYVLATMKNLGFDLDSAATQRLRAACVKGSHLPRSLSVFRKA